MAALALVLALVLALGWGRTAAAPQPPSAAAAAAAHFAPALDSAAAWLPADLFNAADRAAAAAAPPLRVAVSQSGVAAHVDVPASGGLQGPQVQWLQATARALGLQLQPLLLPDDTAVLQALQDGRADLALAMPAPPANRLADAATTPTATPALLYSLGTGAQPLAWLLLREQRPVPLDRARIAHLQAADGAAVDRLRRHHPAATLQPHASAQQALQAVLDRRADAYVGSLLPALQALQHTALPGLELRQVWPGAAGHRHLVLRAEHAALLPALNKAIAAWRATPLPHQAVLRVAQRAAPQLRAPLALPADLVGADTAVMDRLLKPPHVLSANAAERLPLAARSTWRVGVVGGAGTLESTAAAFSGLDAEGRHTGVAADLLQELALRLGVLLQVQTFDNETALLGALRAGRIDLLPLLEHTPQRASGLQFTLPWLELPQLLVGAEGGPLYWGLETLRGRRLALATSHPLRAELQRLHPGVQLIDSGSGAAALALVQQGAADVAMDIKPVVWQHLGSAAGQGLQVLGEVAEFNARYRVAIPEAQRNGLPLLDAALADIDTAERQRSLRRWLVTEPLPPRAWWQRASATPWWVAALGALAMLALATLAALGWRWFVAQRRLAPAPAVPPAAAVPAAPPSPTPPPPLLLEPLLQAAVAPHHRAAKQAGQGLQWSLDAALPRRIHADAALLSQLLELLLSRALALAARAAPAHSPGHVAFKAGLGQLDNGHAALVLAVNTQAVADDAAAAQDPQLVRAQQLALALGGDLVLRSRDGLGHLVRVRLPLRAPLPASLPKARHGP